MGTFPFLNPFKSRVLLKFNSFASIVGSEYPRLSSEKKARDESLSTWSTQLTAGDILDFDVVSCSGIQKCSLFLRLII